MSVPRFCPICGQPVPAGHNACPNCGQPFDSAAPVGNQQPYQQQPPYQQSYQPTPPPNAPKPKNPLILVVIILAGLLVAGIVAAIIYFATNKEEKAVETIIADTTAVATDIAAEPAPAEVAAEPVVAEEPAKPQRPRRSSPYNYVVDGSVGKYKITMEISLNDGMINGRYRYNRMKGAGGWLQLNGYYSGRHFEMYETDNNMAVTGTFSGSFSQSGDDLSMSGNMINAKGTNYSFNVSGYHSN